MARRRSAGPGEDVHGRVIDGYRGLLDRPATPPWVSSPWTPKLLGPTWQVGPDGRWLLPTRTIGWDVLGWCGTWLQHGRDKPWRFTLEQARWVLWWFSLDELGRWIYRDCVLQRLKGWGKDPVAACLCAVEAFGPARFGGWMPDGSPRAVDVPEAWVQSAAVSLEQTKNTFRLFPGLFTDEAKSTYGIQVGKEQIHGLGDLRLIQAVTSSPATLEGARATFVELNETQHWNASNQGHDMADVIERNATKSADGAARTLRITNAYEPSDDSVAQRDREAWEAVAAGQATDAGLLYDSVEAPPDAPLTLEAAPSVVRAIRGDSVWLSEDRIVLSISDRRNPPSRSRRFWYNQITATEDAWATPQQWDARATLDRLVEDGEPIALFFDGSKSDDATALVAACMSDGHRFLVDLWQRPPQVQVWNVPRSEVDAAVRKAFRTWLPVGFFADPGSGDDDDGERYWDALIDGWAAEYGDRLLIRATTAGDKRHDVMWDMRSQAHQEVFTYAVGRAYSEILDGGLTHDGNKLLRQHVLNARRRPNKWGVTIGKEHRESAKKIDAAICMIGAGHVRRMLLASDAWQKRSEQPETYAPFRIW